MFLSTRQPPVREANGTHRSSKGECGHNLTHQQEPHRNAKRQRSRTGNPLTPTHMAPTRNPVRGGQSKCVAPSTREGRRHTRRTSSKRHSGHHNPGRRRRTPRMRKIKMHTQGGDMITVGIPQHCSESKKRPVPLTHEKAHARQEKHKCPRPSRRGSLARRTSEVGDPHTHTEQNIGQPGVGDRRHQQAMQSGDNNVLSGCNRHPISDLRRCSNHQKRKPAKIPKI